MAMNNWAVRIKADQNGTDLSHYGVNGMKWGVRKDALIVKAKTAAEKARDFSYKQVGVNDFDELVEKCKTMVKDPKGIALLAAVVLLPDPLVFGGIAAYNALKAKGKLGKKSLEHSDTLYHYGVKGMKWGVRRTPEQLGHRTKGLAEGSQKFKYRSTMPYKRTTIADVSTAITMTSALVSYAIPSLHVWAVTAPTMLVSSLVTSAIDKSVNTLMLDDSEYPDSEKRSLNRLPRKTKDASPIEDCAAVNVPLTKGSVNNCSNCILAYDMRRRGYDVSAAKTNTPSYTSELVNKFYKGKKDTLQFKISNEETTRLSVGGQKKLAETAYNKMVKESESHYPIGSRGYISVSYANSNVGHVFSWERDETGMNFYDPQSGKNQKMVMYTFSNALPSYNLTRLDNLTPNSNITTRLNDGEAKKK